MESYKTITNLQEYVNQIKAQGGRILLAEKTARVRAYQGAIGEKVISWSVDSKGNPVLEKEAEVGIDKETGNPEWVVTKIDENGQDVIDSNGNKNQWIIEDSKFQKKYEQDLEHLGVFKPIGGVQQFIQLTSAIHIIQWGEEWNIDEGGFVNITNKDDMYVISARDFEDTYREV